MASAGQEPIIHGCGRRQGPPASRRGTGGRGALLLRSPQRQAPRQVGCGGRSIVQDSPLPEHRGPGAEHYHCLRHPSTRQFWSVPRPWAWISTVSWANYMRPCPTTGSRSWPRRLPNSVAKSSLLELPSSLLWRSATARLWRCCVMLKRRDSSKPYRFSRSSRSKKQS